MSYKKFWQDFIRGDKKAFTTIFRFFYEELFNYGVKLTGSRDISEDCLQDLFFKLWKTRNNLAEVDNLKAYLFTSLRHIVYDNLKWYKRQNDMEKPVEKIFAFEFSAEDILIKNQIDAGIRERLLSTLNALSSRQKEAIYLRYFELLEFENIASIMEVNVQSVRNFIHRGIKALRELDTKR